MGVEGKGGGGGYEGPAIRTLLVLLGPCPAAPGGWAPRNGLPFVSNATALCLRNVPRTASSGSEAARARDLHLVRRPPCVLWGTLMRGGGSTHPLEISGA